jgi:hypothetical protein
MKREVKPLKRLREILAGGIFAVMAVTLVYGLIRFPDAPIRKCIPRPEHPDGYCGKQGQAHTAGEYASFDAWQDTLIYVWLGGMATIVLLRRSKVRGTKD